MPYSEVLLDGDAALIISTRVSIITSGLSMR